MNVTNLGKDVREVVNRIIEYETGEHYHTIHYADIVRIAEIVTGLPKHPYSERVAHGAVEFMMTERF